VTTERCASSCPLLARLVIDLARATGRDERLVRLAYGIPDTEPEHPERSPR
jgi:hypothetical protein